MANYVTEAQVSNLATQIATTVKANKVLINNNAADLSALTTTAKGNLVAAINEVRALAASGSATTLDALTDAIVTSPAVGHVLRYNGTHFINVLGTTHFEAAGAVAAHAAVATGAHPATAISFAPANGIAATNAQAAIEEA